MERVLEAVSGGAAQSWQMVNRWQTMDRGEFDFGFAVDWMRKDLAIALAEADTLGIELPLTRLIDGRYAELQQRGGGRQDTSSLSRLLPEGGQE
jgi:3-hydroxyisobutyrate dehydrogenase